MHLLCVPSAGTVWADQASQWKFFHAQAGENPGSHLPVWWDPRLPESHLGDLVMGLGNDIFKNLSR